MPSLAVYILPEMDVLKLTLSKELYNDKETFVYYFTALYAHSGG